MTLLHSIGIILFLSAANSLKLDNFTYQDIVDIARWRTINISEQEQFHRLFIDTYSQEQQTLSPWKLLQEGIRQQAINRTTEGTTCVTSLADIGTSLKQGQPWAIQMIDAIGKPGSGILEGNFNWIGSFSECKNTTKAGTITTFKGQYCIATFFKADAPLTSTPGTSVSIGLCIPSTCSQGDIQILLSAGLMSVTKKVYVYVSHYQPDSVPLSSGAIAMIVILSLIGCAMGAGTLYDICIYQQKEKRAKASVVVVADPVQDSTAPTFGNEDQPLDVQDYTPILRQRQEEEELQRALRRKNIPEQLLLAFSVYRNGQKILNTKRTEGTLDCIHGIRFLSMSWVILGHTVGFIISFITNLSLVPEWLNRWSFQAISNATFSVDSFFVLSGTLISYLLLKQLANKNGPWHVNWAVVYFHRFWRLTPMYMLVLGYYVNLMLFTGEGPLWQYDNPLEPYCNQSWWTNLLYVNNFFYPKKQCMGWSWFLANDMQFFLISPFIVVAFYYKWYIGSIICYALVLVNFISAGLIATYTDRSDAVGTFFDIYVKPYCRVGPYAVGLVTGYLLYITDRQQPRIHKALVVLGWALAAACNLAVLYGLSNQGINGVNGLSTHVYALYTATSRTAWALGLAWVIFACCRGYGGFVNTLLSWEGLVPLSRLTYAAYLIHPIIIFYYLLSLHQTIYMNELVLIWLFLGTLAVSYGFAFVVSLALEAPMMAMEKVLLPKP